MFIRLLHKMMFLACFALPMGIQAQTVSLAATQPEEDFVIASVCVASPGDEIYSALGHACLRLQCPEHGLDYIYSYEAENVDHNVLRFFAGSLKMGVRAVPTDEYVAQYAPEGRGVREYVLNLPIRVKQRLWQRMDERLEFSSIPYDYMNHGCAVSVLSWLEEAIGKDTLEYAPWPEKFWKSRKELSGDSIRQPWALFFLETFIAGEGTDPDVAMPRKAMVPADMIDIICRAKAFGQDLVPNKQPNILLQQKAEPVPASITPIMVAVAMLIVCLLNLKFHLQVVDYAVLAMVSMLGFFVAYLLWFSHLTCTEWNWLIIPFNPFPLLLWKWRRLWAMPYAVICILWSVGMFVYPHKLVDDAHLVLSLVAAVNNIGFYIRKKNK